MLRVGLRLSSGSDGENVYIHNFDIKTGSKLSGNKVFLGSSYWHQDKYMFCERYKLLYCGGFAQTKGEDG